MAWYNQRWGNCKRCSPSQSPLRNAKYAPSLALWATTDFTTIAAPLTDLTCKTGSNAVTWTNDCGRAFVILKERLCSSPVLHSPDFTLPFVLQTDASERWVGAVLSQHSSEGEGQDHPLAYFSKKNCYRGNNATAPWRKSAWQFASECKHSGYTYWVVTLQYKLTIVHYNGLIG